MKINKTYQDYIATLEKVAKQQGKTPYTIASELGVSPSTITRIFKNQSSPKFEVVLGIAEVLNLDLIVHSLIAFANPSSVNSMDKITRQIQKKLPENEFNIIAPEIHKIREEYAKLNEVFHDLLDKFEETIEQEEKMRMELNTYFSKLDSKLEALEKRAK